MRVIVVGAGIAGLATARRLRAGGAAVTVLSADAPGTVQSAGRSRIFRLAHDSAELTDAAARAAEGWRAWEGDAGRALLDRTGLLLTGDVADREVHLRTHGAYASATGAAHPLAAALPSWTRDLAGAAIHAADTIRYLAHGLDVRRSTAAGVDADGVTLTDGRRLRADRVVVCAGADTYGLMGLPEPPRLRHARFSFDVRRPGAPPPCWIQRDPAVSEPFYAVADGPTRYAVGLSEGADVALPQDEVVADARGRGAPSRPTCFPASSRTSATRSCARLRRAPAVGTTAGTCPRPEAYWASRASTCSSSHRSSGTSPPARSRRRGPRRPNGTFTCAPRT